MHVNNRRKTVQPFGICGTLQDSKRFYDKRSLEDIQHLLKPCVSKIESNNVATERNSCLFIVFMKVADVPI
jgi:hypothetical protein